MSRLGHAIGIRGVLEDLKSAEIHRTQPLTALGQHVMKPLLLS